MGLRFRPCLHPLVLDVDARLSSPPTSPVFARTSPFSCLYVLSIISRNWGRSSNFGVIAALLRRGIRLLLISPAGPVARLRSAIARAATGAEVVLAAQSAIARPQATAPLTKGGSGGSTGSPQGGWAEVVLAAQSAIAHPQATAPPYEGGVGGFDGLTPGGVGAEVFLPLSLRSPAWRTYALLLDIMRCRSANDKELPRFSRVCRASTNQRTDLRQTAIFVISVGILRKRTVLPANLKSLEQLTRSFAPPLSSALPAAASSSPAWRAAPDKRQQKPARLATASGPGFPHVILRTSAHPDKLPAIGTATPAGPPPSSATAPPTGSPPAMLKES